MEIWMSTGGPDRYHDHFRVIMGTKGVIFCISEP